MAFSRQEYWSGLPVPSLLHELVTVISSLLIPILWVKVLVSQSCPTLFPMPWTKADKAPLVHGISEARILEWVAISFSRGSSWLRDWTLVSCITSRFLTSEPLGKPILWVQDEKIWGTGVLGKMLWSHKLGSGSARIQAVWLQSLSCFLPSVLKAKSSQSKKLSLGSVAVVGMQRWICQEAEGLNLGPSSAENLPGGPSSVNTILQKLTKIYMKKIHIF